MPCRELAVTVGAGSLTSSRSFGKNGAPDRRLLGEMAAMLSEVNIAKVSLDRLAPIVGPERSERLRSVAKEAVELLAGRTVWNVNSTAAGGGVAEMMQALLAYARGVDVDVRWVVIGGEPDFFAITKRIHNGLHGSTGDGGLLGPMERATYESVLAENLRELKALIRPGDVVILHDPQPAGLIQGVREAGATTVWRCHIGVDNPNAQVDVAWDFLRPYLEAAHAYVFTRAEYVPAWINRSKTSIVQPSIDPFSAKNAPMSQQQIQAILGRSGLVETDEPQTQATFTRGDGSAGHIERRADLLQTGPPPHAGRPLVVQVSRWDPLKDMAGVLEGFAAWANGANDAHLMLVGPTVTAVVDDPEAADTLAKCVALWRRLPDAQRRRIHLATLSMDDLDENAAIVNAVQRHASVVVQKSIAEGFGLTVTEAMWKARPVIASAVGGIRDQIIDDEHGQLLEDPHDLGGFGRALSRLFDDRQNAERLGNNARKMVVAKFLGDRHLEE